MDHTFNPESLKTFDVESLCIAITTLMVSEKNPVENINYKEAYDRLRTELESRSTKELVDFIFSVAEGDTEEWD